MSHEVNPDDVHIPQVLRDEALRRGYTWTKEIIDGKITVKMIRPDGTVAVQATTKVEDVKSYVQGSDRES